MTPLATSTAQTAPLRQRRRFVVRGIVQGVGFRPYVYRLARHYGLVGHVRNTSAGALLEVEGDPAQIDAFAKALPAEGPPLMRIDSVDIAEVPLRPEEDSFQILASEKSETSLASAPETSLASAPETSLASVPSDVAVCAACLEDTLAPANRRHGYPFTNCTNCGPRYSIILDVPYDRAATTMASFTMCADCQAEYDDPADRRFHAQPNACPICGPHLWLANASGTPAAVSAGGKFAAADAGGTLAAVDAGRTPAAANADGTPAAAASTESILAAIIDRLRDGGIVAWKALGGYQLLCDAANNNAVRELRRRKHRNEKPFAVMVRNLAAAQRRCLVDDAERALLDGPEKPIVLLTRRPASGIADDVAPNSPLLGVMLPATPMHALLFRQFEAATGTDPALVMTSGNHSEEPIARDEAEAAERLNDIADLFVHHNRPIHTRVDDSVARIVEGAPTLLRRARGYAPGSIRLPRGNAQVLACGAQQKSTLCLTKAGHAILSQHLGDLENYETLQFFQQTRERMQRLFDVTPEAIAHDLHPGYMSTQIANQLANQPANNIEPPRLFAVQHHHAHIASCMAEHGLDGRVLGVAWDGTGLGTDGTIWGGEFLVASLEGFERFAHLRNIPLVGGDRAAREPWRPAQSYLLDAFDNVVPRGIRWLQLVPEISVRRMDALLKKRIHTIETSSCGRLFDAVASLLGLHQVVSFEGQAAMALELIAHDSDEVYDFAIERARPLQSARLQPGSLQPASLQPAPLQPGLSEPGALEQGLWEIDMRAMLRQIVEDIQRGDPQERISGRFHNTLISAATEVCNRMRAATGLTRVCLSGGCFQNLRLLRGSLAALRASGFEVYFQRAVPSNDGGIALGQAAIAAATLERSI